VVVTVPPMLQNDIVFTPSLPTPRLHFNQRCPMGQVIKFTIFYPRAFWRELGYAGEIVTDRESVCAIFEGTLFGDKNPCMIGFFEGSSARFWSDKTLEERKNEVVNVISKSIPHPLASKPSHYLEKDWMKEQYSLGGYTGIASPGVITSCRVELSVPHGRVHFAGTETATEWAGYMEGGLQAAERVTQQLLPLLTNRSNPSPALHKLQLIHTHYPTNATTTKILKFLRWFGWSFVVLLISYYCYKVRK